MDRGMLPFVLLLSRSEYVLWACLAVAWQTRRCAAAVYTSGLQADSSVLTLPAKTRSEGDSEVALWLMAPGYSADRRQILLLCCINILLPNRPFILALPW